MNSDILLARVKDMVLFVRRDGRIVDANPAAVACYGYDRQDLLALTVYDLRVDSAGPLVDEQMSKADEEGTVFETVHRRRDGTTFPVEVSSQGAVVDGERVLVSIVRDIAEREWAHKSLQEERDFIEAVLNTAGALVVVLDREGRIVRFNRACTVVTGYSFEEVRGLPFFDLFLLPSELDAVRSVFDDLSSGRFPNTHENWWKARDGSQRLISWSNTALTDERGEVHHIVATGIDVTELRQAAGERERLLAEVEQLAADAQQRAAELHSTIASMADGVLVCDGDGNINLVNDALLQLLGFESLEDLIGARLMLIGLVQPRRLDGTSLEANELPISRGLRGEVVRAFDQIVRNLESKVDVYVRASAAPIRDSRGEVVGAVSVLRDITELIELEQLKDQFISAAAHELKTPVTTIKGYAQMMRRWMPHGRDQRERQALDVIDVQADRINRRVQEMLDIARFRSSPAGLKRVRFDLGELAEEVVRRVQRTTKSHSLGFSRDPSTFVDADQSAMEEVLVALLDNAISYSPKGGDVVVRVWADDAEVLVSVADRGVGISRGRIPFVFEPFYEAVPAGAPGYSGIVSLGLHLSKLTMERHGGRIWFESVEGKGSTFCFALPLAKDTDDDIDS